MFRLCFYSCYIQGLHIVLSSLNAVFILFLSERVNVNVPIVGFFCCREKKSSVTLVLFQMSFPATSQLTTDEMGGGGSNPLQFNRRTSGGARLGALSHPSFFSRHNPHPHRVRHIQGSPLRKHSLVCQLPLRQLKSLVISLQTSACTVRL